jgi:hypothetical protein
VIARRFCDVHTAASIEDCPSASPLAVFPFLQRRQVDNRRDAEGSSIASTTAFSGVMALPNAAHVRPSLPPLGNLTTLLEEAIANGFTGSLERELFEL